MNRNDANVTLMNKNDSSGLIKISRSSSAQDRKKKEGLNIALAAEILSKQEEHEAKDNTGGKQ